MNDLKQEEGRIRSGEASDASMHEATTINFDQPDTLVGERLDGRFLIEKNLADTGADAGGIGLVYLAQDMKLMGRKVVVKILQETALKHPDIVRKFLHEKEALIRLDHPAIVRILDSGTLTDGNPFMVMEFIEGYSLRKTLKTKGKLPLETVAHVIGSITDALAAAHSKQILHRDIKPENIMLTPQEDGFDRVRLIDFGIARVGESKLAPATEISRAIGTVLYIAPEQLIGKLDLTPAADIYASAIVAYEMLTSELPFQPQSIAEMYKLEQDGVKTLPSELRGDLSPEAEGILLSALEFDPEKRPQNARAFGRDLAQALRVEGRKADKSEEDISGLETVPFITPAPTDFKTVTRMSENSVSPKPFWPLKWVVMAVLILAVLAIPVGYMLWNISKPPVVTDQPNPVTSAVQHELSYFLMVQKMRSGKPFEAPFKSSGQETLESGYKFKMVFQPDADGYMYVFNEGKDTQGKTGYYLLFPTPSINNGSTQVTKGQQIETAQNTLNGGKGTEVMWLIWSKEKREDLEAVTKSAVDNRGIVKDENTRLLKGFFDKYRAEKSESTKDTANQSTIVKTKGDTIVHRFELEHR